MNVRSSLRKRLWAVASLPVGLACGNALAQAVPGGTLDPLTIPKYVTPLVIPPVLHDDGGAPMAVDVSLRQINQQVLPTQGCIGATCGPNGEFPATPLWAYGDPANPATFNNPGFTIEVTKDIATTVTWKNELVDANGNFLPHIIQDQNGVPIVDQTLHWAAPNQDCLDGIPRTDCRGASDLPYTGPIPMVVHVHGAHVGPGSDGYPEAWWLPALTPVSTAPMSLDIRLRPIPPMTSTATVPSSRAPMVRIPPMRSARATRSTCTRTTSPPPRCGITTIRWA